MMDTPQAIVTTILITPLFGWILAALFGMTVVTRFWVGQYISKLISSVTMVLLLIWGGFYG